MSFIEIFMIAVGLAMDAFAVSICLGLVSYDKKGFGKYIIPGLYFGVFQALMPLIGYFSGRIFQSYAESYGRIIAFLVLAGIGLSMIKEALSPDEEKVKDDLGIKTMLPLAIATSIDALAVGVSFAFLKVNIVFSVATIGFVTFIISALGVKTGLIFGKKYKKPAEITGGIILILIGAKILLEYLYANFILHN